MKWFIKTLFILLLVLFLIPDTSSAREYKARKKTAGYTVEMTIDRNPPIVDKNTMSLAIKDIRGKYVTDGKVLVNYYMPPMPGMPPMNYKTLAKLSGSTYIVIMDLIMSGPWNIVITISRAGKTDTVRFAIDVR